MRCVKYVPCVENLWGGGLCEIFKGEIKKCGFNKLQVEMKAVMTSYCHETDDKYHIIVHTKYMTTNHDEYYGTMKQKPT